MEVERGEVCDFGQRVEAKRLFQMLIDIREHPMHSAFIF